ncbi:MAG TPA: P-loop NTPase [Bacteroidales bacterium]|nr:P-loop NTPase [Bacteroidales bacterium]
MIKIAVASGKGGTGKTFISTNLFRALFDANEDAVLVDCDAEAPDSGIDDKGV